MTNKRSRYFDALALIGIGACAVIVVRAAPQGAAVPISQEHHHHLVIDNQYIRAYEVEVGPHESTLLHRHDKDYVYIVFGDADITNAVEGKQEVNAHLADTTVNFAKGPFAHIARNDGDKTFRNITVALNPRQGELKTYYPTVNAALFAATNTKGRLNAHVFRSSNEATILETDEMRALAVSVQPGGTWSPMEARHACLVVWLGRWREKLTAAKFNALIFPIRMETWFEASERPSIRNTTADPMIVFVLEFKD
jgi:hypothetical protein